ncbi:MAG: PTS sugar transporter subunit IIA [Verrucomicrobiota bacterium]|nr:PTS sugar transporter subunit IIA [Verrucomicrobiota bacterium]
MPHRTLSMGEAADYLHLQRQDLETLVKRDGIPHEKQGERIVFRKQQIDVWASQRILGLSGNHLYEYHRKSSARHHDLSPGHALMPEFITPDRIAPALSSKTKPSILRDMMALAERTELVCDPMDLLQSLQEREHLCSTALSNGVALLHPRHHEPHVFLDSFIVLGRVTQPIHAGSEDGTPTSLFFLVCCQDDRIHLHTLARLCTMIQSTTMLDELRAAEGAPVMLEAILKAEVDVIRRL